MKEIKQYQCEICNEIFDNEESALKCEGKHYRIVCAKDEKYYSFNKFPYEVTLVFSNGKECTYRR